MADRGTLNRPPPFPEKLLAKIFPAWKRRPLRASRSHRRPRLIAISLCVLPINFSARIWACSTEKREHLKRLVPYKVRATPMPSPTVGKWGHAQSRMHCGNYRLCGLSRRSRPPRRSISLHPPFGPLLQPQNGDANPGSGAPSFAFMLRTGFCRRQAGRTAGGRLMDRRGGRDRRDRSTTGGNSRNCIRD